MTSKLETLTSVSIEPSRTEIEEKVSLIKKQQAEAGNRAVAGVFHRFWQQMLDIRQGDKLNVTLKINQSDGSSNIKDVEPEKVLNLDRKDSMWQGTIVDSGINDAFVILTKTDKQKGRYTRTVISVSPFSYVTEDGSKAYKLKPDTIMTDDPGRGAIFRNKAIISQLSG